MIHIQISYKDLQFIHPSSKKNSVIAFWDDDDDKEEVCKGGGEQWIMLQKLDNMLSKKKKGSLITLRKPVKQGFMYPPQTWENKNVWMKLS